MAGKKITETGRRGAYPRKTAELVRERTNFLREWREMPTEEFPKGMSQGDLAGLAGVSLASVSAYERYEDWPKPSPLDALAKALGITRGMILDVDPNGDLPLWTAIRRANTAQKQEIGRIVSALIGPPKGSRKIDASVLRATVAPKK